MFIEHISPKNKASLNDDFINLKTSYFKPSNKTQEFDKHKKENAAKLKQS